MFRSGVINFMFVIGHCSADQSLERGDRKLIMFPILNNRVDIECTKFGSMLL